MRRIGTLAIIAACLEGVVPVQGQVPTASQPTTTAPAPGLHFPPPTTLPVAELPPIAYEDLVLLVETARHSFQDAVTRAAEKGTVYHPPALRGLKAIIHLTLRSKGYAWAEAESPEMDVVDASLAVGKLLGEAAPKKQEEIRGLAEGGQDLGLEFELLGPREYLHAKFGPSGTWSDELLFSFEPAVEGVGVEFQGKRACTRPSEVVSLNYTPDVALRAAEAQIGLTYMDKVRLADEIRYFRFRTYHLWQPSSRARPIVLTRGATVISPESIDAKALDAAIQRMGDYLHYREKPDGWFAQEFFPGADKYDYEANSAVIQMRALSGLTAFAVSAGRQDILFDVGKALRFAGQCVQPLLLRRDAAPTTSQATTTSAPAEAVGLVLWFPGHGDQLENSARMLLMLIAVGDRLPSSPPTTTRATSQPAGASSPLLARNPGEPTSSAAQTAGLSHTLAASQPAGGATTQPVLTITEQRKGLLDGLLTAQDADGRIEMVFGPRPPEGREDAAAAGWALTALALAEPPRTDPRIERAMALALRHYLVSKDWQANPLAAASLARAFALGYAWTNDARASEFVFAILDWFVSRQVGPANCPWPELYGAINAREQGSIGIDTAVYLTALADGVKLAERVGDGARAALYREAVRAAARFVLQLEIREDGCYYIRSPRDALGGVRASPWDHRIRADYCADALVALMRAREVLYGLPNSPGK